MHVYRWDLDRTYLETEIHSVRGLVRAAFEAARDKRTVPGAAALIRGLQATDPGARVSILSGSPLQMRAVLTEKLALDGVRVDSFTLKDNLGNLRRGRLRAVRGQIGFKLPHLLEERLTEDPSSEETLFGDDSEADALIYATYAGLLAGTVTLDELLSVMVAGDAYPDAIERARQAAARLSAMQGDRVRDVVRDIFIRIDRGIPTGVYRMLGSKIIPVFSWFQAAVVLFERNRLTAGAVAEVAAAFSSAADEVGAMERQARSAWLIDAVRRGLVTRELVEGLLETPGLLDLREQTRKGLDRLGPLGIAAPSAAPKADLLGFLRAVRR